MHIDSFSGELSDLKKKDRTIPNALHVLQKAPLVSTWDMSESAWVRNMVKELEDAGLIRSEHSAYPWLRYSITAKGKAIISDREGE